MLWKSSKRKPKKFLGVDIGTTAVKVVEISQEKNRLNLTNYGSFSLEELPGQSFRTFKENGLFLSSAEIAESLKLILRETKVAARQATFTLPDFSSFFTNIDLPSMTEKEIPSAVYFQAKHYVPLPLEEVVIDWSVIEGKPGSKDGQKIKILLVAVPKETINQYQEVAKMSGLELQTLEAEVFALKRALIKKGEGRVICLIDIGAQSTTCSLVDNEVLKISHSLDISSNQLTQILAKSLNINWQEAEKIKKKYGLLPESKEKVAKILLPLIDLILVEIKKFSQDFFQKEGREPARFILAGGEVFLPGLRECFEKFLNKEVVLANPFESISCPSALEPVLKEMGPIFSIATGAALRPFE